VGQEKEEVGGGDEEEEEEEMRRRRRRKKGIQPLLLNRQTLTQTNTAQPEDKGSSA